MSANVKLGRFGAAIDKAEEVSTPKSWALSRRTHFHIDRARSEMEMGHTDAALRSLIEAGKLTPQQIRYHSGARETTRAPVHLQLRSPDTLTHMAAWTGH
ncbi:hypothetical protein AB0I22_21810 [Streptomyces sp. NPDC050610]|uniref:hypothetical protein n=1 Tax=Streptomyces sp. NPDC050610 TaxID=3157097 RepID=UPI0034369118